MMYSTPPADPVTIDRRTFALRAAGAASLAVLGGLGGLTRARGQGSAPVPPVRVLAWCEGTAPRAVYPEGVNGTLAAGLARHPGLTVSTGRIDDPGAGLADAALDAADVLVWWGRLRHADVPDDRAEAVAARVRDGRLGLVALNASFASKPFYRLMGAHCMPRGWREDGHPEHVAIRVPGHPIVRGVGPFTIPRASMFTEPFAVPTPETVFCVSSWDTGETFRSGLTWTIGRGRVAYFRPGHDAFPVLFHPSVRRIIANAALWTAGRA